MEFPKNLRKYILDNKYVIDETGMSGAGVYMFTDSVLKVQPINEESSNEVQMLEWLHGKLPVPEIIEHICENGYSYILMTRCSGKMMCADVYMNDPVQQCQILADAMKLLWQADVGGCPCQWNLERRLAAAEQNIINGCVDTENAQPDTFGPNGFKSPEALLEYLKINKPSEEPVLSHGDFCLPNIFADGGRITGLIDLGKCGVSDIWQDIAICYRSLSNNYNGIYGGHRYPGFKSDMLFAALEIMPDWDRIRYYILLDELF